MSIVFTMGEVVSIGIAYARFAFLMDFLFLRGIVLLALGRPIVMKTLLFAILDSNPKAEALLQNLSKAGFNGTVISTAGLHKVLPKLEGQGAAIALSSLVDDLPAGNFTLLIVVDDDRLEEVKDLIREGTGGFVSVKGGMFALPLPFVEGNF